MVRQYWTANKGLAFFLLFVAICLIISPVSAACNPGYKSCNGQCLACPSGTVLGPDCRCHPACGDSTHSCQSGQCYNGRCVTCPSGSILGTDGNCHKPCGSSTTFCPSGSTCCNGGCASCPSGQILGDDCLCHESCGSSGNYCTSGTCCNDKCLSCPSGYLGTDCQCHVQVSNSDTNSNNLTEDTKSETETAGTIGKIGLFLAKIARIISKIF